MWAKQAKFTALVNAHAADLYRYAFWLCRDRHLADDLVQETFARAWRAFASLRDPDAAGRWLITTLRGVNTPGCLPGSRLNLQGLTSTAWKQYNPDSIPGWRRWC